MRYLINIEVGIGGESCLSLFLALFIIEGIDNKLKTTTKKEQVRKFNSHRRRYNGFKI